MSALRTFIYHAHSSRLMVLFTLRCLPFAAANRGFLECCLGLV